MTIIIYFFKSNALKLYKTFIIFYNCMQENLYLKFKLKNKNNLSYKM